MIKSFRQRQIEKCWQGEKCSGIKGDLRDRVIRLLDYMNSATSLTDLAALPGAGLHPLKGSRKGEHAIRVSGAWRLVFRFEAGDFYGVGLEQYH